MPCGAEIVFWRYFGFCTSAYARHGIMRFSMGDFQFEPITLRKRDLGTALGLEEQDVFGERMVEKHQYVTPYI